ncbi:hypothetical protein TRVA0_021S00914 [Trichomonascus vanleenenianus]|uniref:uncharacterized protein n=1 Tax=Trichomonascus vanleenenianus TaxID=2268995 RepID=UPI003EC95B21
MDAFPLDLTYKQQAPSEPSDHERTGSAEDEVRQFVYKRRADIERQSSSLTLFSDFDKYSTQLDFFTDLPTRHSTYGLSFYEPLTDLSTSEGYHPTTLSLTKMVDYDESKLPQRMRAQTAPKPRTTWKNDFPRNPQQRPGFPMNQEHHLHYRAVDYPQYSITYSIKNYLVTFPAQLRNNQLEFATFLQNQFLELPLSSLKKVVFNHLRNTCITLRDENNTSTTTPPTTVAEASATNAAIDGAATTTGTTTSGTNTTTTVGTKSFPNLTSTTLPGWQQTLIDYIDNYQFIVIFLGTLQTVNGYMSLHCIPFNIYLTLLHALLNYAIKLSSNPDKHKVPIHATLATIMCHCPETWISFLEGQFTNLQMEYLTIPEMMDLIQKFDNHLHNSTGLTPSHMRFLDFDRLIDFPTSTRLNCDDQQQGGGYNLDAYNRAPNNTDQMTGQVLLAYHLGTSKIVNDPKHVAEMVKLLKVKTNTTNRTQSANAPYVCL